MQALWGEWKGGLGRLKGAGGRSKKRGGGGDNSWQAPATPSDWSELGLRSQHYPEQKERTHRSILDVLNGVW